MALSFVVDTSVLKRLRHPEVRRVIEPLAARGELGRPTICDLEVGYSARNGPEWDRLVGALDAFQPIDRFTSRAHISETGTEGLRRRITRASRPKPRKAG